jgi:hypothetical protein
MSNDDKTKRLTKKLGRLTNLQQGLAKDTGNVNMGVANKMDMISRYNTTIKKIDKTSKKLDKISGKPPVAKASTTKTGFKMGGMTKSKKK